MLPLSVDFSSFLDSLRCRSLANEDSEKFVAIAEDVSGSRLTEFLEGGGDPFARNEKGFSLFDELIKLGNLKGLDEVYGCGTILFGTRYLRLAVMNDCVDVVRYMVERDVEVGGTDGDWDSVDVWISDNEPGRAIARILEEIRGLGG